MAKYVQTAFLSEWPVIRFILIYCAIGISFMAWISTAYEWHEWERAWIPLIMPFWPIIMVMCCLLELYKLVRSVAIKFYKKHGEEIDVSGVKMDGENDE